MPAGILVLEDILAVLGRLAQVVQVALKDQGEILADLLEAEDFLVVLD